MSDIEAIAKYSISELVGDYFKIFSGINTNCAEGLNNLFKLMSERKIVPPHVNFSFEISFR